MKRRKRKNLKKQTKLTNDNRWHFQSSLYFCYLPCTCKIKFIWPRWEIDSTKKSNGKLWDDLDLFGRCQTSIDIRIDVFGVRLKLSLNWIFYYVNIEVATHPSPPAQFVPFSLLYSFFARACLTFAFCFLRTFHKDLRTNAQEHAIIFKADDFCLQLPAASPSHSPPASSLSL